MTGDGPGAGHGDGYPLFAVERREAILRLLEERTKILVPELCEYFKVSPATIRGDLRDLEAGGRLKRAHGGAVPVGKASFEPTSRLKEVERVAEKRRIAGQAAGLVEDGDTIVLDTGTTTLELAKCLAGRTDLTVVTNDLDIAAFLERASGISLVMTGGTIRRGFHCVTGPVTLAGLRDLNVDKAFLAANAYSLDRGFTTPNIEHAEVKRSMLAIAAECIMLMDSAKIGRTAFVKFADIADIDRLITDNGAGREVLNAIRERNPDLDLRAV